MPCQRGVRRSFGQGGPGPVSAWQDARLEQHLKTVADAEHQLVGSQKPGERLAEPAAELPRKDHAGPDVIAVTEAAGHAYDLKVVESLRLLEQAEEVHALGLAAGRLERERSLHVAIRAGRSQNANSRCWHTCLSIREGI